MKKKYYFILAAIVFCFLAAVLIFNKEEKKQTLSLSASVNFVDKKFTITNEDTVDFVHADISIDEYYKVRDINLRVGETYTMWQTEFLHHNGTHYPINRTPSTFSIWCEIQDGRKGFVSRKIRTR